MRKWEVGMRKWEGGMRKWECGSGKAECGSGSAEVGRRNAEVGVRKWEGGMRKCGSGKSEVRKCGMRKWEVRKCGSAECGSGRSEVGRRNAEVGVRKWEVRNAEVGVRKWEVRNAEVGVRKWECGMRKWEFGSGKAECGSGSSEVGVRKWEGGMRKWEFGSGKAECGSERIRKWECGMRKKDESQETEYIEFGRRNGACDKLPATCSGPEPAIHCEGRLAVYLPDDKILLAADMLEDPIWIFNFDFATSIQTQLAEFERMSAMGIERIYSSPTLRFLQISSRMLKSWEQLKSSSFSTRGWLSGSKKDPPLTASPSSERPIKMEIDFPFA